MYSPSCCVKPVSVFLWSRRGDVWQNDSFSSLSLYGVRWCESEKWLTLSDHNVLPNRSSASSFVSRMKESHRGLNHITRNIFYLFVLEKCTVQWTACVMKAAVIGQYEIWPKTCWCPNLKRGNVCLTWGTTSLLLCSKVAAHACNSLKDCTQRLFLL